MGVIKYDGQGAGLGVVRAFGQQIRLLTGEFTFGDDYKTGGVEFDLSEYFPKMVSGVLVPPTAAYHFYYTGQGRLQAFVEDGDEVADDTDLSEIGWVPEIRRLTLPKETDDGTFKIKYKDGDETSALDNDIDAATLEGAIEDLTEITHDVEVLIPPGGNDAEGDYIIVFHIDEEDTDLYISDNSLEDDEGDPVPDPSFEVVQEYREQGIKFFAWGY